MRSKAIREVHGRRFAGIVCQHRRYFIAKSAAVVMTAAIAGGIAYTSWPAGSPRHREIIEHSFQELDRQFAGGGFTYIAALLALGSEQEILQILRWIAARSHQALTSLVVVSLSDLRIVVRREATSTLLQMPPLHLRPHLQSLRLASSNEADAGLRQVLDGLVARVQSA